MDPEEILHQITSIETAEVDPGTVAEVFAYTLATFQDRIDEADVRRMILLAAAMYRNSIDQAAAELQLPVTADPGLAIDAPPGKGFMQ